MPRDTHTRQHQAYHRAREIASATADATDRLTADPSGAGSPFPELADPPGDYELSVWVTFNLDRYDRDDHGDWPPVIAGNYALACGREHGLWRLTTRPWLAHRDVGDLLGEPVITLSDQDTGLQPLTVLRALLGGRLT